MTVCIYGDCANLRREPVGSAPGERTKIIGVLKSESFQRSLIVVLGGSKYGSPMVLVM